MAKKHNPVPLPTHKREPLPESPPASRADAVTRARELLELLAAEPAERHADARKRWADLLASLSPAEHRALAQTLGAPVGPLTRRRL
jgi:hypothetical protein